MSFLGCVDTKLSPNLLLLDAGACVVYLPRIPTWGTASSSVGLKLSFCDFSQTFRGGVWFSWKLRKEQLWLLIYCLERLCKKPNITNSTKHACFACVKCFALEIYCQTRTKLSVFIFLKPFIASAS